MTTLKLYYNPGSCSLASHIALEASGLEYSRQLVDLTKDEHLADAYLRTNQWGKVPALQIDGEVLTENVAILQWIADQVPGKKLLPKPGTFERARANEWLALLSSTVHVAFRPIFRPTRLATSEAGAQDVKATGFHTLNNVFTKLSDQLGVTPYTLGDQFSLCDAYLFVFITWSKRPAFAEAQLDVHENINAFADRMAKRTDVTAALNAEQNRLSG